MRSTNFRKTMLALTAVAVVALMAAPISAAQAPTLQILSAEGPQNIRPEIDNKAMQVDFRYSFDNGAAAAGSLQKSNVPVTIEHDCPNYVLVNGPGLILIPVDATAANHDGEADFTVSVTRQAPGLTQIPCEVSAIGGALNAAGNTETGEVKNKYQVSAAYYGAMHVSVGQALQKAGPQKDVNFDITLTNFGNAKTSVIFSLNGEPSGKRWEQILPPPVLVDTLTTGGNNVAVANFQVSTPYKTGWNNELGSYQLLLTTEAFDDANQKGNTMTADVLIRVRGVFVPGFEVVALIGSLLGSVVFLGRRQQ